MGLKHMTRQEMFNLIVEKNWGDEIKKKYGRAYVSCSNDVLSEFVAEKQKGQKSAEPKKSETKQKKQKTQEELLAEINERVEKYKESTKDIREKSAKLDSYTKLLKQVNGCDAFLILADGNPSITEDKVVRENEIKFKFEDNDFVRELLVCFVTERINALLDSIDKTKKSLKTL